MRHLPFLILALILAAGPAHAAPIGAVIGAISGALGWLGSTAVGSFLLRTAASLALSALSTALAPRQKQRGVATKATTSGGTQPQTIILGRYATGGNAVCPPMTHGIEGGDVVKYLNYVFDISDFPITSIDWVYVDGEKNRFAGGDEFYGTPAVGTRFAGLAWLRWYDGTQTAADSMLVDRYDEYTRPWTADHILTGVAYAVLTFKYSSKEFQGFPEVRFEVRGAPLYDPRKDSTAGGSGAHRWDDQDTWEYTENPVVMVYNILRGLTLADGSIYGLGVDADDLPIGRWVAEMNTCDELVPTPEGEEPRYRAGIEFSLDQEPLDVIAELLKSCGGHVAESGGAWNISVGPAPFPVASFTDDDIIVSDPREFEPFRGLNQTYNGIHASYLNPDKNWQARDAAPYYRADLESEDGGRRLIAELRMSTVIHRRQVQRLMQEMLLDNRRMAVHALTLPPTALGILPLDTITWTSSHNGYSDKLFEVQSKTIDPATLCVRVTIRERDVADYSYDYDYAPDLPELPTYGEDIGDGAPDTGTPDDSYTDPISGDPLDPEVPTPATGDIVALHSSGLNRSTDGGANWTYMPTPLIGAQEFSVLDGGGFVILTSTGAHFSSDLRGWNKLEFTAQADVDLGLSNGDYELGTLSGWSTVSGSPVVLDTTAPAQQGGTWYLTGADFVVEQLLDIPTGAEDEVVIAADAYAAGGSSATLSVVVSEKLPQLTGDQTWNGLTIENYATAPDGSQLDLVITAGTGAGFISGGEGTSTFELQYTTGTPYSGPWVFAFYGMTNFEDLYFSNAFYGGILVPHGNDVSSVNFSGTRRIDTVQTSSQQAAIVMTANTVAIEVTTLGGSVGVGPNGESDFYNAHEYTPVTLGTATADSGAWETLKISGGFAGKDRVNVRLEGSGTEAYFDNVRAYVQTTGADTPEALATDYVNRRHLVACRDGIHAVADDGVVTALSDLPFQPDLAAAHGDTFIIASGADIAISTDAGSTWAQHTAGAAVTQLFATPAAVAVLSDGSVVSISAGGLTTEHTFAAARWLAYARRPGEWIAVDVDGDIETGGLAAWAAGIDQPVSVSALERRALAVEAGRRIGWTASGRDIFYRDLSSTNWSLGYPLVDDIVAMREVK